MTSTTAVGRPLYEIADDPADVLDQAADEIAAELIVMAAESPDGLALLDRIMDRVAQTRYIATSPLREV